MPKAQGKQEAQLLLGRPTRGVKSILLLEVKVTELN